MARERAEGVLELVRLKPVALAGQCRCCPKYYREALQEQWYRMCWYNGLEGWIGSCDERSNNRV